VLLGISLLLHAWLIASSPGAFFDMVSYRIQAATVFDHQNVYAVTERYPYPPVWIWIVAGLRGLATLIQVPFDALVRAPATLGDLGIGVVLYGYARDRIGAGWRALTPSALYLLNPAVLLISAAHGQFDSLVILFVLLAFYLRGRQQNGRWLSAGLALGIAIALKGFPILLLPYLVMTTPAGKRMRTAGMALLPLGVSVLIYVGVFGFTPSMVTHVLGYRSTVAFGWSIQAAASGLPAAVLPRLGDASHAFIIVFGAVVPLLLFRSRPAAAITLLFATFYASTWSMSVQYLLWIVPFLSLALPVGAVVYSAVALAAEVAFYFDLDPEIIPGAAWWSSLLSSMAAQRLWIVVLLIGVFAVFVPIGVILVSGGIALYLARKSLTGRGHLSEMS
jgi:4-amino-4-deoxy-L-arabinose transferase-like glycosyltransferase